MCIVYNVEDGDTYGRNEKERRKNSLQTRPEKSEKNSSNELCCGASQRNVTTAYNSVRNINADFNSYITNVY
jgi:hypothetical protein